MSASNVNVVSNIYIRNPDSISGTRDNLNKDPVFVAKVSGTAALAEIRNRTRGIAATVKLNSVQEEELMQGAQCSYAIKGDTVYGKVLNNGKIEYQCRCENTECHNYSKCNPKKFDREAVKPIEVDVPAESIDILTWVDLFDNKAELQEQKEINQVPEEETVNITEIVKDKSEYIPIDALQAIHEIIESDIDGHILVNAGPGTGKTYTAIQRLMFVLQQVEPEECDRILVLCYTRAAVGEIRKRIEDGIRSQSLPNEAAEISIATLDSFATSYLLTFDDISQKLGEYDYNKRIQLFNQKMAEEDFDDFRYCIIDELQDLVNDRALMTLQLIKALRCGYLLLGDKWQAIYDYDCKSDNSMNSTQFYAALKEHLPSDIRKYEIIGNKRQTELLNKQSEKLRYELLHYNKKSLREQFSESLYSMPKYRGTAERFGEKDILESTAILCRNNGEAEYMSWLLHKNQVKHNLVRTNSPKLTIHRCIADALWDLAAERITAEHFRNRLTVRSGMTENDAQVVFAALSDLLYEEYRDYIECNLLAKKLCQNGDLPDCILNVNDSLLTVSTIHKAKGREFEKVYLLGYRYEPNEDDDTPNTEEERVLYVAETRPKKEIALLPKQNNFTWFFRKNRNNRWIRTERIPYREPHCAAFATGLEEDIDYSSFVKGELEEALIRQEYISSRVRSGDTVKLRLNNGNYDIYHENTVIGRMSASYVSELTSRFTDDRCYIYQLPTVISDLYVENVFTYVSSTEFDNIPLLFRSNRFWLAVEITGFGKTIWQENHK